MNRSLRSHSAWIAAAAPLLAGMWLGWQQDPVIKPRKVERAARPVFSEKDVEGIFFADLFRDGLVGDRPMVVGNQSLAGTPTAGNVPAAPVGTATEPDSSTSPAAEAWSGLLTREALENEIKRLQIELETRVTTPGKFSSEYSQAHHAFAMLATWFSILHEYDGEVRWKASSGQIVATMIRASINTRTASADAFRYATQVKQSLTDMIRGESFASQEKAVDTIDWSQAVERSELMVRLDELSERLAQSTANDKEFAAKSAEILQGAGAVAALARVLTRPGVADADDEGYAAYAVAMQKAGTDLVGATRLADLTAAQNAVNSLRQSCDNCHSEWR